jgi:hypothetical protein
MSEIEALREELIGARAEIQVLMLRLSNVTLLLKKELIESEKLPKEAGTKGPQISDYAPRNGSSSAVLRIQT